ncbi:MAG: pre-peptidase C-terminal domain-containing protein [Pleurocapsa sp.]
MVKVYLPSFAICTLSLTVNLLVLGIYPLRTIAQESVLQTNDQPADKVDPIDVEPEILAEINRVRTNPQGYAHWLEDQKQYYDNIWLKLPGEKPIRAHRLEKAINEAISVLKEQKPLPPLSTSEQTSAAATQKLEDFASANKNIQNISYGRITPKGIVMSLVVDELFPDRRRRKKLLSPNAEDTGVVCQNDPRYAKVCAIAYSNPEVDSTVDKQPDSSPTETESIASQQPTPAPEKIEPTTNQPDIPQVEDKPDIVTENTDVALETLPQPPQPQLPPTTPEPPEADLPAAEAEKPAVESEEDVKVENNDRSESGNEEVAEIEDEDLEEEVAEIEDEDLEEDVAEIGDEDLEEEVADSQEEEKEEVFEAEENMEDEEQIATNSDNSRLLENVERGVLEEGDRIIAEDGSFYDSYPLSAKSGESFTIALESDEFDAFVALIDSKGNIIEQNDDINEENSNSRIRVTIPENGTYNVIVNAYDEGGSGEYVLTVSR